jgi:hypothetical protein
MANKQATEYDSKVDYGPKTSNEAAQVNLHPRCGVRKRTAADLHKPANQVETSCSKRQRGSGNRALTQHAPSVAQQEDQPSTAQAEPTAHKVKLQPGQHTLAAREQALASSEQAPAEVEQQLAICEQAFPYRQLSLASREQAVADREHSLASREQAFADRELKLSSREQALANREQQLASCKQEWQQAQDAQGEVLSQELRAIESERQQLQEAWKCIKRMQHELQLQSYQRRGGANSKQSLQLWHAELAKQQKQLKQWAEDLHTERAAMQQAWYDVDVVQQDLQAWADELSTREHKLQDAEAHLRQGLQVAYIRPTAAASLGAATSDDSCRVDGTANDVQSALSCKVAVGTNATAESPVEGGQPDMVISPTAAELNPATPACVVLHSGHAVHRAAFGLAPSVHD